MSLVREANYAGRFYPSTASACDEMSAAWRSDLELTPANAALAPHAGWIFSGATANLGISAIAAYEPETIVIFGAVHVPDRNRASLFHEGIWRTPYGDLRVDEKLARAASGHADIEIDPATHQNEHSIEVELPLIRRILDEVRILPIMVSPGPWAAGIGRAVARAAIDLGRRTGFLASTDLTHYGPAFHFEPQGHGADGFRWAKDVNDRRFISRVANFDLDGVVPEARANRNACGSGAVAATIAAAVELGAESYRELEHTSSFETDKSRDAWSRQNSVGYHAGIFVTH